MVEKKKDEVKAEPSVDGFKLSGKLTGTFKELASTLRTLSFLEVAQEKEAVNAAYVESRDIKKDPYLFSIAKITKDNIDVVYSIPPGIGPRRRRLDIIRYLLNVLSVIEPYYKVDNKVIYQLMENSVKDVSESVSLDYSRLYTSYDTLKKEVRDLRLRVTRLRDENEALRNKNYELKTKNDELMIELRKLETLSDSALKTKLQEWIAEHNGEIDVNEFSRMYKVPERKVENALNELVSSGYLAVIG